MPSSQDKPLCVETRMLFGEGTGVGTYARAVRHAQQAMGAACHVLADRAGPGDRVPARWERWLRAIAPQARRAAPAVLPDIGAAFVAPDLFRLAQVWFDIHRRLLPVMVPGPRGIMHWSYPVPIRVAGWANVYTVHDAIPLDQPELSPISRARHARLLRAVAAEAGRSGALVTVSEDARGRILEALGGPPERVIDCSQAVDPLPERGAPVAGLDPGGYLLVCGSIEPRKNIARILAAYRASGLGLPLVLAGPDGWRAGEIAGEIARTPGAIRLPYLDRGALVALIAQARALLMPSLAEGFGLPVAEAMALGTPVVTSLRGALAETAGGAALLVDPVDTAAIAAAIRRIADDADLRATLIARGRANARRFTPARFADRLAAVYAGLVAPAA